VFIFILTQRTSWIGHLNLASQDSQGDIMSDIDNLQVTPSSIIFAKRLFLKSGPPKILSWLPKRNVVHK
jgi:hypothetical protein